MLYEWKSENVDAKVSAQKTHKKINDRGQKESAKQIYASTSTLLAFARMQG